MDTEYRLFLWHLENDVIAMELLNISINLLASYYERRSLIGYVTHIYSVVHRE